MIAIALVHFLLWREIVSRTPSPTRPHRDVVTTQGRVRGYLVSHPRHFAFLGLPYARPPTRYDRFKAPEPPPHWDGIFEAIHRVKCPQMYNEGIENCLVINVFTPEEVTSLPVVVHIHDGDFQRGWGFHKPPSRLLKQGLIVVSFNYRLGALGFLCLRTADVPGNAGLKDQVAALYWVQQNIKNFGGNPLDVTIYGTGAGAVSVELLLLSGATSRLFNRVILESGSALQPTSLTYNPIETALEVALTLGYKGEQNEEEVAKFFQHVSAINLVNVTEIFLPCIEKESSLTSNLLEIDPVDVLKDAHFMHVPLMIAYTNAPEVKVIADDILRFNVMPENIENLLPTNLDLDNEELRQKLGRLVKEFYFAENEVGDTLLQNYVDYVNDVFVDYPVIKSAILHARASPPVYLMKFTYRGSLSSNVTHNIISGAGHGDILKYISSNDRLRYDEQIVAEKLATLMGNFIKLGDPTPLTTNLIPVVWESIPTTQDFEGKITVVPYLLFDKMLLNQLLAGEQLIFWDRIYNKFYKKHSPT